MRILARACLTALTLAVVACDSSTEPDMASDAWPGLEFRAEARVVDGQRPDVRAWAIVENVSNDTIQLTTLPCAWLTLFEPGEEETPAFYPPRDLDSVGCFNGTNRWTIAPGEVVFETFDDVNHDNAGLLTGVRLEDIPPSTPGFPGPYRVEIALRTLPGFDPDATGASREVEIFVETGLEFTIPQAGSPAAAR